MKEIAQIKRKGASNALDGAYVGLFLILENVSHTFNTIVTVLDKLHRFAESSLIFQILTVDAE